jgi:flagellar motor switch protein FliN
MNANLQENWIKQVEPLLFSEDEPSLLGPTPPFAWEELAKSLQVHLNLPKLSLHPRELYWRDEGSLFEGLENSPQKLQLILSPLEGSAFWIMPEKDLWHLFTWVLAGKATNADILNDELKEGFYQFIALEVLSHLEKSGLFKDLSPQLAEPQTLPKGPFLCLDVGIQSNQTTLWGRICLSPDFRRAWKHFHEAASQEAIISSLAPKLEFILSVEAGEAILSASEWETIQLGDLLILEKGAYDPELKKGNVHLTFKGKKIFRGRLRHDYIKLSDYPLYFEELGSMDKDPLFKNHQDKSLPEDDFSSFDEDEEDLFLEDEELAAALEEELHLKEEEGESEEEQIEQGIEEEKKEAVEVEKKEEEPEEEKKTLAPNEIPFVVNVEIAHLRMTVQQLMELSPGNQLSLGKEPDNLVDLVVNGKCIGKGELIRVGEVLGVRILHL